jgi:ribosomal protein S21
MNTVLKKLQFKEDTNALILNAPQNYVKKIEKSCSFALKPIPKTDYDIVQLFVVDSKELNKYYEYALISVGDNTIFWVCYPKKSSGVKTDLSRNEMWELVFKSGYRPVSMCSIDDVWSAVRLKKTSLVLSKPRPKIDITKIPPDFEKALRKTKGAYEKFIAMAPSHKREYIESILEAKKPETRQRRIEKAVEMIKKSIKN